MTTQGQQILLDIWFPEGQDIEKITNKIGKLVDQEFTVVKKTQHKFDPQGRTIVYILSESHFTVHTYPEHNYISLDIYICNPEYKLAKIKDMILDLTPVKRTSYRILSRGQYGFNS